MLTLFDAVALLNAHVELDLVRGQVGSVVDVDGDGEAYEVEFSDPKGETYALAAFPPPELLLLVRESHAAA
jgi:hypothetical protein